MVNLFGTNKASLVAGLMFLLTKLENERQERLAKISSKQDFILILLTPPCLIEPIGPMSWCWRRWIFLIILKSRGHGGSMRDTMVHSRAIARKRLPRNMALSKSKNGDNHMIIRLHSLITTTQTTQDSINFTKISEKNSTKQCQWANP